ncbi:hypothetical protein [Chondromyces crocatus]|uniref:Uncharacterized protein n=1 Tax=Chondromyces crocatus TaxID=52 RepID=A0A0K1EHV0_CHOCO|nr:hypothetical protein [Chondromyces crocatus]AKT40435.1 uncharacterized protein CMC5_045880 [Chondromyces crocatus]
MSQTRSRPSAGVRYVVVLESGEEVVYRGFAFLPDADLPLEVRFAASGAATAKVDATALPSQGEGAPDVPELEREAAALLRAAVKASSTAGRPPPRRVVRWRA